MLGVALSACAAAASHPPAASNDQRRTVDAAAVGAADVRPAHLPSSDRVSTRVVGVDRPQPSKARQTLRSSRPRPSPASTQRVYAEVDRRTPNLDASLRARIAREILAEAARARLDPLLVLAVIHVESSFEVRAISRAGAAGLMQLREPTMADVVARAGLRSSDALDPIANIQAGVRYLAELIATFGDPELALMAYNAGPGRIGRCLREGGVPERFRGYPQSVARELVRLGGSLEQLPARSRRAVSREPTMRLVHVHQTILARPAFQRARAYQSSPTIDAVLRTGPRAVEHSRQPGRDRHHEWYQLALVSTASGRGARPMEGS